jgi:archaellum component FlaC
METYGRRNCRKRRRVIMVEFRTVQDVMDKIIEIEQAIEDVKTLHENVTRDMYTGFADDIIDRLNEYIELLAEFEIKRN